jgi:hypothetical protein
MTGHRRSAAAAGLVLAAAIPLIIAGCGDRPGAPAGGPAPAPGAGPEAGTRGRVVLFGVDGADWRVIDPLVGQGRLPHFGRVIAEGSTGVLRSMDPSASPSLWTTIATGVRPERHGIHGFVVPRGGEPAGPGDVGRGGAAPAGGGGDEPAAGGPGSIRPVTSDMRRAPAFWTILPRHGRSVGVVGWLVTWPAEPVDGFIVSSYLPYLYNWSTGRPLKGTIVEGIPRQTWPESLLADLEADKVKPADLGRRALERFYDPGRVAALPAADRECVEGFVWSLACDETYRRIGLRLFDRRPVDLFAVYFGGIDVASHRFWKFAFPDAMNYGVGAPEREVLGRVLEEYYVYVDGLLGEYLERLRPEDTLLVLSDHGFRPVLVPGRPTTSGHHRPEGILGLLGRGARRGHRFGEASILDVLPTILMLVDVPISRDLEGRILEGAIDPRFAAARTVRSVDSYALPPPAADTVPDDLESNVLERLRSLGYID